MRPVLIIMSIFLILGGSYFLSNQFCPAVAGPATNTLSLIDGDFKAASTGNYGFQKSAAAITMTKDAKENYFKKTGTYLAANPEKMLALTGIYGSGEINKTKFEDLGVARAEAVKAVLVKNGASVDQINTAGIEKSKPGFIDKKLYNSVDFVFTNIDSDEFGAAAGVGALGFDESKTVYFENDETGFPSDDAKLLEIIDYLESYLITNPDAIVTVHGYTDNQGSSSDKMNIAKKRVERVRRIIRKYKGGKVFSSPMVVRNPVGPQDPQADNETSEGIALNNRVTITIE